MKRSDYKYTAFISYRHVEPDATIAAAVHKIIETFKVPKEFYEEGKPPVFRVFRDREELSAIDLSDAIQEAISQSYYFIVINSKRTPLSQWCTRELELFRSIHGDERILSVLVEGEPYESFARPMLELKKTVEDETGQETTVQRELLAAELRPEEVKHRNFVGYEVLEKEDLGKLKSLTKESLKLLNAEKYRIMAAILGCTYGDLKQRDKERKNKRIIQVSAFLSALFLIFALFMFNAYRKENISRREAMQTNSTMLLNRSREILSDGDQVKSLLVAKEAMSVMDEKMSAYERLKSTHQAILSDALYPVSASLLTRVSTDNRLSFMDVSKDGKYLATGLGNDGVGIFDAKTGALIKKLEGHKELVKIVAFHPDGKLFLSAGFDDIAILWDLEKMEKLEEIEINGNPLMARFSGDGKKILLAGYKDQTIHMMQVDLTGKGYQWLDLSSYATDVRYTEDAKGLLVVEATGKDGNLKYYNFEKEKWERTFSSGEKEDIFAEFQSVTFSKDNKSIYAFTKKKLYKINISDGKILYSVDVKVFNDNYRLIEREDLTTFFIASSGILEEYDAQKGEKINNYLFVEGSILDMAYDNDTNTVAVALESGKIGLWRDGSIIDTGVDLLRSKADQMIFSPEGDYLYIASKSSKEVLILHVNSRSPLDPIKGQVVASSTTGKSALIYGEEIFTVWDTQKEEVIRRIPGEKIGYAYSYFIDELTAALSDDGNYLMISEYIISDKDGRQDYLRLVDLVNLTETKITMTGGNYKYAFHPDNSKIAIAQQGLLKFIDFQGNPLGETYPYRGQVKNMVFSEDGKRVVLNFQEGNGTVYNVETGQQEDVSGEVLWLDENSIKGIYNSSVYADTGEGRVYHILDKEIEKTPVSSKDISIYHQPSDRLLIIRNGQEKPVAYLMDFSTGRLLRSFYPSLTSYLAKGYFEGERGGVVLDQSYSFVSKNVGKEIIGKSYPLALRFYFEDYEKMLEDSDQFLGDRSLSPEERKELGLDE